jgi:hypothetical protein
MGMLDERLSSWYRCERVYDEVEKVAEYGGCKVEVSEIALRWRDEISDPVVE